MINMKSWAADIIDNPHRVAIPIMTHPGIEMIGCRVADAVRSGRVHSQAILALNDKYPAHAVTAIMDLTVEAEAFGSEIVFPGDDVPSVTSRLVCDSASIEALQIPPVTAARIPQYLEANRLTAEAIAGTKPIFGGCIGPFSLAGRLFDLSEFMMAIYIEPETVNMLLEKCTLFLIDYARAMKATDINGIVIAEPAAGLVSNDDCTEYSSKYVRRIVEAVQDDNFMIILHNCGNTGHCTEAMVASSAAGCHFGNKIDIVEAIKGCPSDMIVLGNLDPVELFKQSDAVKVKAATTELLVKTKEYRNFVLSSGCDVPPHIPLENIDAFYRALAEAKLA